MPSFDDIAADLAGIRFAGTLFAEKTAGTVPTRLLGMMDREDQIFPKVRDLPSGMTARVFKRRFGAVDSPAYKEMIASIQKRIDALPFHAGT